ncbi:hypothetical protein [Alkaliphilus transvaalensis]|uniref:hypothetical protein n=1 Tax=Alkaliphilus transvaalensis TaxID=114628 RepID=UPI00047A3DF0|nr:hypothetical protein [Alkaliphilus transvaalensis]
MSLDEATKDDVLKDVDGIPFIIDKKLDDQYDAIKIDFRRTAFRRGFNITLRSSGSTQCT